MKQAVALQRQGKLKEAELLYRRILQTHPAEPDANHNLGVLARQLGKDDDSLPFLRAARDNNPGYEQYHLSYAEALMACQRPDESIAALEFARTQGIQSPAVQTLGIAVRSAAKDLQSIASIIPADLTKRIFLLFRTERFAELELILDDLLARQPQSGFLWKMQSATLARQNKDALAAFRRAADLLPDDAEAQRNFARYLISSNDLRNAEIHLRRVLDCDAAAAEDHVTLADLLRTMGGTIEAIRQYQCALALDSNLLEAHVNLGNALKDAGRLEEAESSYRRALLVNPKCVEAHCNLGIVLKSMARNEEAERSCRLALQLEPNLVGALVLAAKLAIDGGRFEEAENLFRQAGAIDPHSPEAWAGIPGARRMTSADEPWAKQAAALAARRLPPEKEAFLRYALGKYFDDVKDYDRAFPQYHRANELGKIVASKHGIRSFDPAVHAKSVERRIAFHERAKAHLAQSGNSSDRPVFIIGMPRSGTSLAEQILASHPQVFGAGELPFWGAAAKSLKSVVHDQARESALIEKLAGNYLEVLNASSPHARHVVDKMPSNFLHLGLIHLAFPNARFIHMQRNPLDVCLSIYFQAFAETQTYANDLANLAHYYREYERLMRHWRSELPAGVLLDVPYESLVENQETWSRTIIEFIGLEWDERCLNFHENERAVRTPSNWQVRQKITNSSVARWRHYEKFIGPLMGLLA